jgi:hypothetical protein
MAGLHVRELDVLAGFGTSPEQRADVRLKAAELLLCAGDLRAGRILQMMAADQALEARTRLAAARLLPEPSEVAAGIATDPRIHRQVRAEALRLAAPETLLELIRDPGDDSSLRLEAIKTLAVEPLRTLAEDSSLRPAERLRVGQVLASHGDPLGADLLCRLAMIPETARAAVRILLRDPRTPPEHLARLVRAADLDRAARTAAVRALCERSGDAATAVLQELATDRGLEPPYRAWAAWRLTHRDPAQHVLLTIATDGEIDDWIRLAALKRLPPATLDRLGLHAIAALKPLPAESHATPEPSPSPDEPVAEAEPRVRDARKPTPTQRAAVLLTESPERGIAELHALIDRKSLPVAERIAAATLLLKAQREEAVPALAALLRGTGSPPREALDALREHGGTAVLRAMVIDDALPAGVRLAAAEALAG